MKSEDLYRLWAYDLEVKLWSGKKETDPEDWRKSETLKIISNLQDKAEKKRKELYEFIETIEDPYYRVLLTCRCIDRKTWKEVAQIMGGTPDSHRMALQRFIDEQQQQR